MRNSKITLATLAILGALAVTGARADGHYVPGVEGIQAASMPPPGNYYVGYLVNYNVDNFRAPGGSTNLPGHNTATVSALANRFVWVTGQKVLGADYGVEAIVPVIRTSLTINAAGIADSRSGVGDVYVGPLMLGWHGPQWDAAATAGIWLDNGSTSNPASPGKGFKSTMLTGGATYYFDAAKSVSGAALMRYEVNGKTSAGFRPGDQATLEWSLAKALGAVTAGVVGYSQWQTKNDQGPGASSNRASRHAVGAELAYPVPGAGLFLKGAYYKEINAEAGSGPQPKGSLVRFTVIKAF